jgi:cell division protein FtsQ
MTNVDFSFRRKVRKYFIIGLWLFLAKFIITIYLLSITQYGQKLGNEIKNFFIDQSSDIGFFLKKVNIQGQNNTQAQYILGVLNLDYGTPILGINLVELRKLLEQNDWVKSAIVARKLPNTLYIGLVERKAIAIWQHNNNVDLIDDTGFVIKVKDIKPFKDLLYVVGDDANLYAKSLIDLLSSNPQLKTKVVSAIRYGQRRWDILLENNINVKLPENNTAKAWAYIGKLDKEKKLFSENFTNIDLRDENRYYFSK